MLLFDSFASGKLEQALAAWKYLRETGQSLDENAYFAYHECLTRCGAWTKVAAAFRDQQERHSSQNPTSTPAPTPSQLAFALRLANRLVRWPVMQTLHAVGRSTYDVLVLELELAVPEHVWAETVRLLKSDERFTKAIKLTPVSEQSIGCHLPKGSFD